MPDWRRLVRARLGSLALPARREAEIEDELVQLLEDYYAQARAGGAGETEALEWARSQVPDWEKLARELRAARRDPAPAPEAIPTRAAGKGQLLSGLGQDLRYGARTLIKTPGSTVVAVVTLALGIGLNTAVFSVVNAMLFRPLPVERPGELAAVYNTDSDSFLSHKPLSVPDYEDLRATTHSFGDLAAYALRSFALERGDDSRQVLGEIVTSNYFTMLGVKPLLGRVFTAEDGRIRGASPYVVLSHSSWRRAFGGDPGVVGKTLRLNGSVVTVVGVGPPEFRGLVRGIAPELWLPMSMGSALHVTSTVDAEGTPGKDLLDDRRSRWALVMGRLRPGVSAPQAASEMAMLGDRLRREHPDTNQDRTVTAIAASDIRILPGIDGVLYSVSVVVMVLVGLVLLIASTNVASLLLARATARRKEIALRQSLGASRARLVRQLLTESLLLSLLGGTVGLMLAAWSNRVLEALPLPLPVQLGLGLSLDTRVLGFTLAASCLAALVFGLAPALQATRADLVSALKEESATTTAARSRKRLRGGLVVAQVSLSLLLLICAGLALRSVWNASRIDPGFEPAGAVAASFSPDLQGYGRDEVDEFYRRIAAEARALPGVESAAFVASLPLTFELHVEGVAAEGRDAVPEKEWPEIDLTEVSAGYFETMRIPIVSGRSFGEGDGAGAPRVAVVNETLASRLWPGEDAVGKRLRIQRVDGYWEVVGVARSGKYRTLGEAARPFLYLPLSQHYVATRTLVARARGDARPLFASLRHLARRVDARVPMRDVQALEAAIGPALLLPRAAAIVFGLFGLLGLTLAAAGIYGVISFAVGQRTHEIGIRMAVGARPRDIAALMLRHALALTLGGGVLGLGAAVATTRLLGAVLYGISATDAATFAGVSLFLLGVAAVASYVPARRASKLDPVVALREL